MKKDTKDNIISLRLNEKEYQHLTDIAEKNNISLSKVVRSLIDAKISSKDVDLFKAYSNLKDKHQKLKETYLDLVKIINERIKEFG